MEETSVLLLNQNNKYSDKITIERELKLNCYHSYISSFFIKPDLRLKLLSVLFIDLELNKILMSNTEKNILIIKFDWWKISCSQAIEGKPFAVPILRILKKVFLKDEVLKSKLLNLINLFQSYSLETSIKYKIKAYYKYIKFKNSIVIYILDIKINNQSHKSLNFASMYKTYEKFNRSKEKHFCLNKAKILCKRPKRNLLILFLLNSSLSFKNTLLLKQLVYAKFRYW